MTWQQHLKELTRQIVDHVDKKYAHGQFKHGGELWRKNLTANRVEEAVDQLIYTLTDAQREKDAQELCERAISRLAFAIRDKSWHHAEAAQRNMICLYKILKFGNPEGEAVVEKEPPILEV